MHPIERLRYVARASSAPQGALVREAAAAMSSFGRDPAAVVTVCRRLVARQPTSGPLVWLAARMLTASDCRSAAWEAVEAIEEDRTAKELERALPSDATICVVGWPDRLSEALPRRGDVQVLVVDTLGEGSQFTSRLLDRDVDAIDVQLSSLGAAAASADLVVIEASAAGPTEALAVAGSRAAAAVASAADIPVWLVTGVGCLLPQRMWDGLIGRVELEDDPWEFDDEVVPMSLVSHIAGPNGVVPVDEGLRDIDCPITPELFAAV